MMDAKVNDANELDLVFDFKVITNVLISIS